MSKLVTQRLEYAIYDDATGALSATPPTYPTVVDTYSTEVVASATQSYGSTSVGQTSSSATSVLNIPAGATLLISAPSTNTNNVCIKSSSNVPVTPGGTSVPLFWTVQPGQTVTLPACYNSIASNLSAQAVDTSNNAASGTWQLQIMWSL